jgi:AcrR family transcriptional regulator
MPYPSKTDRQTILSAAVMELVHGGIRGLSLRNIAASLDLAPNAIYRYFPDRRALEAALANEAARRLELALRKAADGREPVTAIRKMSSAYIKFARDNPHLYEAMMSLHAPGHDATSHLSLWTFTVAHEGEQHSLEHKRCQYGAAWEAQHPQCANFTCAIRNNGVHRVHGAENRTYSH